ncbi:nitrate/nitrite two-component system sensor histidine kinase NarQ [Enterobacteriaceae bacterium H20N1]|uniref:Sensor protein n=1 Tax=Dryocola boscaweniae TaxID=2925397 RepID=A0A9X2W6E5_9ENTR|nr:nitrate/nitrite two-component system sensor histidine kinase NarQ [Dryocola boscaweniae]MCT4701432.1 nitrate/nitrite two-component system sensor histidine kinase NarQ [Dryocola boscaweniae]MCT4718657.1 nitrate/nitrite two-component system sensor histidine kinase NarQ [Dryocola boscaweniae]
MAQRSVRASLARAFLYLVLLSLLSTGIAILTLASSLRDAEAVNIAGSLRMQSYRLGYDLQGDRARLNEHLTQYNQSLRSEALLNPGRFWVPKEVRERYNAINDAWADMEHHIRQGDIAWYHDNIAGYVAQIDLFVLALQHYAERKMMQVVATSVVGFIAIFTLVFFTLRRFRHQVVAPLNKLMLASKSIERGKFAHPPLDTDLPNEIGLLARTFTRMADELQRLYRSLEDKVQQKTLSLQEANRTLEVLYSCSQALNVGTIDRHCFTQILQLVRQQEKVDYIEMLVGENWLLCEGTQQESVPWQSAAITQQDDELGQLRWQASVGSPPMPLMQSVASMLGRGLYFNQAQKHYQQLLLMQERATIARELHDSLAQVLSYLRIQLTLLKRAVPEENEPAQRIIGDFSQALNDAYRQLRELLATFRLTLQQADLPAALQEMIAPLRQQTDTTILLDCRMPTQALDAQQQVHLLQIIREAVLNAIKHAGAQEISITCTTSSTGEHTAAILDNGKGIASLSEPEGHYGLNIMHERAAQLGGRLTISRPAEGGTLIAITFRSSSSDNNDEK